MAFYNKNNSKSNASMKMILMIIGAAVLFFYNKYQDQAFDNDHQNRTEQRRTDPASGGDDFNARDLNYRGKDLVLTKHAKCRMNCRFIDAFEVNEVLSRGKINKRKSNPNDRPCPTYALEFRTSDGQQVRAVVAECDNVAKLVTVIDLENNYKCHCK